MLLKIKYRVTWIASSKFNCNRAWGVFQGSHDHPVVWWLNPWLRFIAAEDIMQGKQRKYVHRRWQRVIHRLLKPPFCKDHMTYFSLQSQTAKTHARSLFRGQLIQVLRSITLQRGYSCSYMTSHCADLKLDTRCVSWIFLFKHCW